MSDAPCGTLAAYNAGHRCDQCKAAKRDYIRSRRAAARANGFAGLTHGRIATYDAGCKCKPCRRARSGRPWALSDEKRYRLPAAPLGTCPVCNRDMALLAGGFLITHGPIGDRCPGTHGRPAAEQEVA